MRLARVAVLSVALALAGATTAAAQAPAPPPSPPDAIAPVVWQARSGDAWIDRQLADINVYGARYRGAFVDEVVRYHAAPRELVTELVTQRDWAPGDVYYACTVAQIVGKPCRQVVELWSQGQADGWEIVSQRAGMTTADARARSDIRESFARWGRPLAVEAEAVARPKQAKPRKSPNKNAGDPKRKR